MKEIYFDESLLVSLKCLVQTPSERPSTYFARVFKSVHNLTINTRRCWDLQKVLLQVFFHGCHDYGILRNLCVMKWVKCAPDFLQFYNAILVEEGRKVAKRLLKKKGIVWKNKRSDKPECVVENNVQPTKDEVECFENNDDSRDVVVQVSHDGLLSQQGVDCDKNNLHDDDVVWFVDNDLGRAIKIVEVVEYFLVHVEWQVIAIARLHLLPVCNSSCYWDVFSGMYDMFCVYKDQFIKI